MLTLASSTCAGADAIFNSSRASLPLSLSLSLSLSSFTFEGLGKRFPRQGGILIHRIESAQHRSNRSAAIAMALTETITFESHPGWTLQARFFRDVKNAEEVGNLIVAGKLPVKTSVINAKLVPGERELRRNRKEGRKAHERARVRYPLGPGVPQRARPAGRRRSRSRFCPQKQGAPPLSPAPRSGLTPGLGCPCSFVGAGRRRASALRGGRQDPPRPQVPEGIDHADPRQRARVQLVWKQTHPRGADQVWSEVQGELVPRPPILRPILPPCPCAPPTSRDAILTPDERPSFARTGLHVRHPGVV